MIKLNFVIVNRKEYTYGQIKDNLFLEVVKYRWKIKNRVESYFFFFSIYFIDYAITVVPFSPLHSPLPYTLPPAHIPPAFSSCPCVVHVSYLASTFPILFLTSPCLLSIYHLCYLFSVPSPPLSPSHSRVDNPPCDLHFCGSVPVLVVCLVCFYFCFRCGC